MTIDNFYELFNGILNPKQLDGLRLLVTQFPQQQFNATADRKTEKADGMFEQQPAGRRRLGARLACWYIVHVIRNPHLIELPREYSRSRLGMPNGGSCESESI